MTDSCFLQIHTLHSYPGVLLNRDDTGQAKCLPYGGVLRTRISSQCLKWHWRYPDGSPVAGIKTPVREKHALQKLAGFVDSKRSRALVKHEVIGPLRANFPDDILDVIENGFDHVIYGESSDRVHQTLLFGRPELDWLRQKAESIAGNAANAEDAEVTVKSWAAQYKQNIEALRASEALPGGLVAALFGRMVTSDLKANIEAPIYVAHSFTVHAAETEVDFFIAADDLANDQSAGADHLGNTELTSGIYYGYVVVDMPGLVANCNRDRTLAAEVVNNLLYLIAEVSPGAKIGSTAPFSRSALMLVESGDRQPRSLAAAFRKPVEPDFEQAISTLKEHLRALDRVYETGEKRRHLSLSQSSLPLSRHLSMKNLAAWAANQVRVSK
ncbi:MAG TPA: type I-E CRISPR-associated protein Cas7/Cse4/CasC [Terracidiphilus sp.]|nr:type I-E CRISPR-associated protein Cas7/Cse4/CasC [Terracidiphilus sp.]